MIDTTVTNCGNEGDVTGVNNLGGLCYELYSGTMTGCYNTGRITATGTYVGGLMAMPSRRPSPMPTAPAM